jgi:hypothetical protein
MTELEKMREELQEIQFTLSGGSSFAEAMKLTARLKELQHQIAIAEAKPAMKEWPPEYKPGGRASEMRKPPRDVSSPFGNGHDPLRNLFGD